MNCRRCGAVLLNDRVRAGSSPRPWWATTVDGKLSVHCPTGPDGHEPFILGLTPEEVLACYPNDGYDDDRPGVIRVHVAQARAEVFKTYAPRTLRRMAELHGVKGTRKKADLAWELAIAGARP